MSLLNLLVHHTSFFAKAHDEVANLNGLLRAVSSGLRVELQNYGMFVVICGPQELHIASNLEEVRQWISENVMLHDVPQTSRLASAHRFRPVFSRDEAAVIQLALVGNQLLIETASGSYVTSDGWDEDGGTSLLLRFRNA